MDYKKLSLIIPMGSVLLMIVWGTFVPNGWSKSWIAVIIGGVAAGIIRAMGTEEDRKKAEEKSGEEPEEKPAEKTGE